MKPNFQLFLLAVAAAAISTKVTAVPLTLTGNESQAGAFVNVVPLATGSCDFITSLPSSGTTSYSLGPVSAAQHYDFTNTTNLASFSSSFTSSVIDDTRAGTGTLLFFNLTDAVSFSFSCNQIGLLSQFAAASITGQLTNVGTGVSTNFDANSSAIGELSAGDYEFTLFTDLDNRNHVGTASVSGNWLFELSSRSNSVPDSASTLWLIIPGAALLFFKKKSVSRLG